MSGDALQKFKDSTSRAIAKISVKTSSSLEKSKIKMHIESLSKDVQRMLLDAGEEVYSLWLGGEAFQQSFAEKLEAVKQKKNEIERLSIELASIDERDNEILGRRAEPEQNAQTVASRRSCCPNCGSQHEPAAKFCRKCGCKLQ